LCYVNEIKEKTEGIFGKIKKAREFMPKNERKIFCFFRLTFSKLVYSPEKATGKSILFGRGKQLNTHSIS